MKAITSLLFLLGLLISPVYISSQQIQRPIEQEMIEEINYVRQHPQEYAQYIMSYTEYWDSSPGEISEAKKLVKILTKMKPLQPLEFSEKLYQDGLKHAAYMAKKNVFKHSKLPYAENLVGGEENVRFSVISLLIDYGVPGYGHRMNLLDPIFTKVACIWIEEPIKEWINVFIQEFE